MTMSPGDPGPTDPAQGAAVPPYEGRRVGPAHHLGTTRGEDVGDGG